MNIIVAFLARLGGDVICPQTNMGVNSMLLLVLILILPYTPYFSGIDTVSVKQG